MNNAWQRSEKMKNFEPIRFDYDFETDPWEPDKDSAEWILDIAALIDKIYYVLSIEEFTEIFNSRKGYHMELPEMRKALSIMFYLTMADAVGEFEDDPEEKWDGEEDLDEFLYFLPLRDKKTGIEYVTCLSAPDEEDLLAEYIGIKKTKPLYIPSPEDVTDIHMAEFPIHNKYHGCNHSTGCDHGNDFFLHSLTSIFGKILLLHEPITSSHLSKCYSR